MDSKKKKMYTFEKNNKTWF